MVQDEVLVFLGSYLTNFHTHTHKDTELNRGQTTPVTGDSS